MTYVQTLIAAAIAAASIAGAAHATTPRAADDAVIYRDDTAPRGGDNERAGDRQRGRGKAIETYDQLAREAGEGPRGGDNERPGDRQRRGRG